MDGSSIMGSLAVNALPSVAGAFLSGCITVVVFGWLNRRREQEKKAVELFERFLTEESMIRSRLVAQEYLVPGYNREKFEEFEGQDFEAINECLESLGETGLEIRVCIRAIPSFFWLVDEAMRAGVISKRPELWSRVYSYYYVLIIEPRRGQSKDPLYRRFDWMLLQSDVDDRRQEFMRRIEAKRAAANAAS